MRLLALIALLAFASCTRAPRHSSCVACKHYDVLMHIGDGRLYTPPRACDDPTLHLEIGVYVDYQVDPRVRALTDEPSASALNVVDTRSVKPDLLVTSSLADEWDAAPCPNSYRNGTQLLNACYEKRKVK